MPMETALESLPKSELIALLQRERRAVSERNEKIASLTQDASGKDEKIHHLTQEREHLTQEREHLTREREHLTTEREHLIRERDYLKAQVEMLKRMQFGQKRERFEGDPSQMALPFEPTAQEKQQQEATLEEQITYTRKKASAHKGRAALPDHLPVEEIEIYPEGDLSAMVCIGKDVTEELECEPARFYIKRYIRYKYAANSGEGILTGELPERVIDNGIPGSGLLSMILVDKYLDHLPLYRQKQRFAREGIRIPSSTIEGWTREALLKLHPLYEQLVFDMKSQGYLQMDETPIKVLESNKKGACHQGWYWVYHAPLEEVTLFDYQPTRGRAGVHQMLKNFQGYLQTDGYGVYEQYARKKAITHLACWAHARREFERALENDKSRASHALVLIQKLYAIERQAKEAELEAPAIKELRLNESLPVINELGKWIFREIKNTLPKSQIGKAMSYAYARWDALCAYLHDGSLKIDNNPVENSIRPVALGRKNYLFAGSHESAQRAAMIYSFFAICKKHEINPYRWL